MLFHEMSYEAKEMLENTYKYVLAQLYPDKYDAVKYETEKDACIRVLEQVRMHMKKMEFSSVDKLELLPKAAINDSLMKDEYVRFSSFWNDNYISEFMFIGKEITPFNTYGHVCGVHYAAMHVAEQLKQSGFPVDLALVSAAAASHDLGKYGCTGEELKRVPYLHYYYTHELLERMEMSVTAKLAGNHSVWDLERTSLSAEWMILIYADFRVKSRRDENGVEKTVFTSLEDAFQVIIEKLDNVDEEKAERYKRAYARLKKFEDYMVYLGVDPDLDGEWKEPVHNAGKAAEFAMMDYQLRVASQFNYLSQDKMIEMLSLLAERFGTGTAGIKEQTKFFLKE